MSCLCAFSRIPISPFPFYEMFFLSCINSMHFGDNSCVCGQVCVLVCVCRCVLLRPW